MVKGMYHYIAQAWKKPAKESMHQRLIDWRAGNTFTVVDNPLRLDRARALGYKAKKGFVVVRVRLKRGGRVRPRHKHGRKSTKQHSRKTLKMNYKWVAEQRVANYYKNLEVLNSYQVGKDGKYYFFEVIMVDSSMPEIANDSTINWICKPENKNRAHRGLTSAGKQSRGLRHKHPTLGTRPSVRAGQRSGK